MVAEYRDSTGETPVPLFFSVAGYRDAWAGLPMP